MLVSLARRYLRPYAGAIAVLLVLQLVATLASLYLPSLNADIVDQGVTQGDTGYILRVGGWMLVVSLLQVVGAVGAVVLGARAATAFARDLRRDVFDAVQGFSARELGHFGAPSLITRSTNDVQQVMMVVLMTFTILVMAPIMMVGGVVMALREDPSLSLLLLVVVPVLGIAVGLLMWRMVPYFRGMQTRIDAINGVLREQITGLRVVRAFVREDSEVRRFGTANTDLYDVSLGAGKLMALAFPMVMLIMNLSQVAVLWFGAGEVADGDLQVGSLMAFLSYIMYILMAVMMSTMIVMMVPRAAVAAGRIGEVLDTETSVVEPAEPVSLADLGGGTGPRGRVAFEGVEFGYPGADEPVLHDLSFVAEPGQVTAIIGSTGSGKSTLLNLVPRLFDATAGRVTIDGVDVRDLTTSDLG
jgi:ATP-binding cassette subfamily B multidrug efflux pump